jgi:hypothetical protein
MLVSMCAQYHEALKEYHGVDIVRLVGQVVRVSVGTVKIVNELPERFA